MIVLNNVAWRRKKFQLFVEKLRLHPGLTLLVGRNGAGKTTLLHMLATALFPQSGEIRYGGKTAAEALPLIRGQIGFVPTGLELYEEMKPGKLLGYLAQLKGIHGRTQIDALIAQFHLQPFMSKRIKKLPYGIRQRIAIAQSLLGSPSYLFLDEPLNYLDSPERKQVVRHLAHYGMNRLIVVSTHELNEWAYCAERILWFEGGRPLFYGTPAEWTNQLPASLAVWQARMRMDQFQELPENRIIHFRIDGGDVDVRFIGHEGMADCSLCVPAETTLEDAYFIRSRFSI